MTDSQSTSGPANVERMLAPPDRRGRCDAFFTCGSSRLMRVQQRLALEFGLPGQVAMEQQMACGLGMCFCCVRDFNVNGEIVTAGCAGRAGIRPDGGAAVSRPVDLSVRVGGLTLRNPVMPASGTFAEGPRQGDGLQSAWRLRHQDDHARAARTAIRCRAWSSGRAA